MPNVLPTYRLPICANSAEIDPGWVPGARLEYDLEYTGISSAVNVVGRVLVEVLSPDRVTLHWFLFDPTAPQAAVVPGRYPIPAHAHVTLCLFTGQRGWSFQPAGWSAQGFPARTEYHRTVTDRLY